MRVLLSDHRCLSFLCFVTEEKEKVRVDPPFAKQLVEKKKWGKHVDKVTQTPTHRDLSVKMTLNDVSWRLTQSMPNLNLNSEVTLTFKKQTSVLSFTSQGTWFYSRLVDEAGGSCVYAHKRPARTSVFKEFHLKHVQQAEWVALLYNCFETLSCSVVFRENTLLDDSSWPILLTQSWNSTLHLEMCVHVKGFGRWFLPNWLCCLILKVIPGDG